MGASLFCRRSRAGARYQAGWRRSTCGRGRCAARPLRDRARPSGAAGCGRRGPGGGGPRFLASPKHPGRPTSPMHPIGTGVRGTRSIYRRVGCPNLPQRPRSSRSAGEESLIFRASSHGRSRSGAPLWQIWTRPRPGPSREPHPHHPAPAHPRQHVDPDPRTAHAAGEARIRRPRNRNTGGGAVGSGLTTASGESVHEKAAGVGRDGGTAEGPDRDRVTRLTGAIPANRRSPEPACAMRARRDAVRPASRRASPARHDPSALDTRERASHNASPGDITRTTPPGAGLRRTARRTPGASHRPPPTHGASRGGGCPTDGPERRPPTRGVSQ